MVWKTNDKDGEVNYCESSILFFLDEIRSKEYNFLCINTTIWQSRGNSVTQN